MTKDGEVADETSSGWTGVAGRKEKTCSLYYKCFTTVIYDRNATGLDPTFYVRNLRMFITK
jgi:hypothetical protein